MTLPVTFSYTGVKYTSWVRKRGAPLKCAKAKSRGSKPMARSWPGEAGDAAGESTHLGFLEQSPRGAGARAPSFPI